MISEAKFGHTTVSGGFILEVEYSNSTTRLYLLQPESLGIACRKFIYKGDAIGPNGIVQTYHPAQGLYQWIEQLGKGYLFDIVGEGTPRKENHQAGPFPVEVTIEEKEGPTLWQTELSPNATPIPLHAKGKQKPITLKLTGQQVKDLSTRLFMKLESYGDINTDTPAPYCLQPHPGLHLTDGLMADVVTKLLFQMDKWRLGAPKESYTWHLELVEAYTLLHTLLRQKNPS
ncbi:MAG TPA: hypothetical protein DCR93_33935 [Cytophagales bacterium]|nr:hypothetical protein [Cytophagales bacterium]HAP64275.1 hypothetical protein [Cytophagales bacterium]